MFKRQKVIVPAAAQLEYVQMAGVSIAVEKMNDYDSAADAPLIFIENETDKETPLYEGFIFNGEQEFDRVIIKGTTQSAGDTIYLLFSNECLDSSIIRTTYTAVYKPTFQLTGTDNVQTLAPADYLYNNRHPSQMIIQAVGNAVRYSFGADPTQPAPQLGYKLDPAAQPIKIEGQHLIEDFRYINDVAATVGYISITLIYE